MLFTRFNSSEHIQSKSIEKGQEVYCAPRTSHTTYVFLEQLRKLKGTDASWKHDEEPPEWVKDFSDDEEERKAKKKSKPQSKTVQDPSQIPNKVVKTEDNPFYRRERKYNPHEFGPIQWNSMHTQHLSGYNSGVVRPSAFPQYPPPPAPYYGPSTSNAVLQAQFNQTNYQSNQFSNSPFNNPYNLHSLRNPPPPPPPSQ